MVVLVNGAAREVPGAWASVPELVHAFYACGRFPGEMITEIRVGGVAAALDDAARLADAAPRVEVQTMPGRQVLHEALDAMRAELAALATLLRAGAAKYRLAIEAQAHEAFAEALGRLENVAGIARDLADLAAIIDLGASPESLAPDPEALEPVVSEMIASQERSDWVMLADLMEYELAPLVDRWREGLNGRSDPAVEMTTA